MTNDEQHLGGDERPRRAQEPSPVPEGQLPHAAPKFTQAHPDADWVCEHGTACDVHCCNCHSGFLFDADACVCVCPDDDGGEAVQEAA